MMGMLAVSLVREQALERNSICYNTS